MFRPRMKSQQEKVKEEYCWAITHAVERSCCCRSAYSVLKQLTICVLNSDLHKIRLARTFLYVATTFKSGNVCGIEW